MSQYRDLIARMAVDAEFAQHARSHPDVVAAQYGLSADEAQQLRGLADASTSAGPTAPGCPNRVSAPACSPDSWRRSPTST
jgi:hypothetical protein